MTIIEAAIQVLKKNNRPMSAQAIYDQICKDKLFDFKAKDPVAILKAQLRRNCVGFSGKSASDTPRLKQDSNKLFTTV